MIKVRYLLADPNGPVYDAKHGIYHLFWQNHLQRPGGGGPVYGHAASRDLAHWTRLPVAIWNDQAYDANGIYTGSATVVDGQIYQVYPSMCWEYPEHRCDGCVNEPCTRACQTHYPSWPDCTTGGGLSRAGQQKDEAICPPFCSLLVLRYFSPECHVCLQLLSRRTQQIRSCSLGART